MAGTYSHTHRSDTNRGAVRKAERNAKRRAADKAASKER